MRLHRATDWLTASYRDIQALLHHCDILAIKAAEVLRGTAKQVALEWIFSEEQLLLAAAERRAKADPALNGSTRAASRNAQKKPERGAAAEPRVDAVLAEAKQEIVRIERYYDRAANKAARITYVWGMVWGVAFALGLLALSALLVHLSFYPVELEAPATQNFFVAYAAGALGAVVSVLVRMKREDGFRLDYEVGRSQALRLGSFRPFIGGVFGLVVYFALESELLQLAVPDQDPSTGASAASFYFLALIAFVAGFSERFTHVVIGGAERSLAAAFEKQGTELPPEGPSVPPGTTVTTRTERAKTPRATRLGGVGETAVVPTPPRAELAPQPAAVDGEDVPVHVLGGRRDEERDGAGDVCWSCPPPGRDPLTDLAVAHLVRAEWGGLLGLDVAGRDGIDANAQGRPLVRQGLGEPREPALARGVGRDVEAALEGEGPTPHARSRRPRPARRSAARRPARARRPRSG